MITLDSCKLIVFILKSGTDHHSKTIKNTLKMTIQLYYYSRKLPLFY